VVRLLLAELFQDSDFSQVQHEEIITRKRNFLFSDKRKQFKKAVNGNSFILSPIEGEKSNVPIMP